MKHAPRSPQDQSGQLFLKSRSKGCAVILRRSTSALSGVCKSAEAAERSASRSPRCRWRLSRRYVSDSPRGSHSTLRCTEASGSAGASRRGLVAARESHTPIAVRRGDDAAVGCLASDLGRGFPRCHPNEQFNTELDRLPLIMAVPLPHIAAPIEPPSKAVEQCPLSDRKGFGVDSVKKITVPTRRTRRLSHRATCTAGCCCGSSRRRQCLRRWTPCK